MVPQKRTNTVKQWWHPYTRVKGTFGKYPSRFAL